MEVMMHRSVLLMLVVAAGCGNGVSSTADAKAAYLGLDASIDKAIALGFDGFNAATNGANIPTQMTTGMVSGTMTVDGTVDRGASTNRTMTLTETLAGYSDDGKVTYASVAPASLKMILSNVPTGTLSGSLDGSYTMTGMETGQVTLAVTFNGQLEAGATTTVERKPGSTTITGTATSPAGVYMINVTR
jgi:hypothetical protein